MSAKTGEQGEKEKEREFEEEEDFENENESDEGDGIDNFLLAALQHPKDRQLVLKLDTNFEKFILDPNARRFEFPPMNPYHRRIVHRVAQYFKLDHVLDSKKQAVVIYKNQNCTIPELRLSDLHPEEDDKPTKQFVLMKRKDQNSNKPQPQPTIIKSSPQAKESQSQTEPQFQLQLQSQSQSQSQFQSQAQAQQEAKQKTIEEREEDYQKARARIFSDEKSGENIENGNQNGTKSTRTPSPTQSEKSSSLDSSLENSLSNLDVNNSLNQDSNSNFKKNPPKSFRPSPIPQQSQYYSYPMYAPIDSSNPNFQPPMLYYTPNYIPQKPMYAPRYPEHPYRPLPSFHPQYQGYSNQGYPNQGYQNSGYPIHYQSYPGGYVNYEDGHRNKAYPNNFIKEQSFQNGSFNNMKSSEIPPTRSLSNPWTFQTSNSNSNFPIQGPTILVSQGGGLETGSQRRPQKQGKLFNPNPPNLSDQTPSSNINVTQTQPTQNQNQTQTQTQVQSIDLNSNQTRQTKDGVIVFDFTSQPYQGVVPGTEPLIPSHILEVTDFSISTFQKEGDGLFRDLKQYGATIKNISSGKQLLAVFKNSKIANKALQEIDNENYKLQIWRPNFVDKN